MEAEEVAAAPPLSGKWQVAERTGEMRDAAFEYRDPAARRIGLTALERALSNAGVPYRVEGGSLIYRTQSRPAKHSDCHRRPADEVAVVFALRPCFRLTSIWSPPRGWHFSHQHRNSP